jgi:hypothetical protein
MKKQLLVALALTAVSAATAFAGAGAGTGVLGSVHDMNVAVNGTLTADNQGRVCAFCHTPHHAIVDATDADYLPLWSHDLTTLTNGAYTQYGDLSYTYDADTNVIDALAGPSRLCMSCHDGLIAPDQHYGGANSGTKFAGNDFLGTANAPQIGIGAGGELNKTHPIGFNLADAIALDLVSNPDGKLGFVADLATSATFLGTGGKAVSSQLYNGLMTCATCHDVHNKDNVVNDGFDADHTDGVGRNYLVFAKQAGSQLCLSCHAK